MSSSDMPSLQISVVIPTYNRSHLLGSCLKAFERQTFDKDLFEVIVVNDGSTDATAEFLTLFQRQTEINFRVVTQPNRGVSAARNAGIKQGIGAYVAFTDDDCNVPVDWIERMDKDITMIDDSVAGIGGPLDCITEGKDSFSERFVRYLDEFNYMPVMGKYIIRPVHISNLMGNEQVPYIRTSNAVFKKRCLEEVGGFDPDFKRPGGEDPDLCYRLLNLGYSFYFDAELIVLHKTRENLLDYFKSLGNYIEGETRKSVKRHLYRDRTVQNSYRFIPIQKFLSLLISIISYPLSVIRLFRRKGYRFYEIVLFPLIVILSKIYALVVSCYYCIRYMKYRSL